MSLISILIPHLVTSFTLIINCLTISFINWTALKQFKLIQLLVLFTILTSSLLAVCIPLLRTGYTPYFEAVFCLLDSLLAVTTGYALVVRLQCMLPIYHDHLRLFAIIPTLYPFTNIPRILTRTFNFTDIIYFSKLMFLISGIILIVNATAMHVLLIFVLRTISKLEKYKQKRDFLSLLMLCTALSCIATGTMLLVLDQPDKSLLPLFYLFYGCDFMVFCMVNRLIVEAMKDEGSVYVV